MEQDTPARRKNSALPQTLAALWVDTVMAQLETIEMK